MRAEQKRDGEKPIPLPYYSIGQPVSSPSGKKFSFVRLRLL
jgi:hypothetical protein